ncbi:hypothetical protein GGH19_003401 [Coemansia sp. RSA 1807]|nr:hypothetical protein LPJ69_002256 [Coemansia sp. RSA 1752]KAJ1790224.1 hypothetical protein LPJ67_002229 [Coemansia sp. RSA 1938]KAJ2574950.1 hypothetical protein GGH19_003401 [Coemansia sp. RSA 1807]
MSRVRTAFRPLETTSSFESVGLRRAATSVPSMASYSHDSYAHERMQLLSRLEQRWSPSGQSASRGQRSSCVAPVPRKNYAANSSRPSSSGSLVEDEMACVELRGIFGSFDATPSLGSRSSSASSDSTGPLMAIDEMELFPLEEIIVPRASPIPRSGNPMPLNASFGAAF